MGKSSLTVARAGETSWRRLLDWYGLEICYTDGRGVAREAPRQSVLAALRALGAPVESDADIETAAACTLRDEWQPLVPPVLVAWDGCLRADIRLPVSDSDSRCHCRLVLEDGTERHWTSLPGQTPIGAGLAMDGTPRIAARVTAPWTVPDGYHRLLVQVGRRSAEAEVIAAPTVSYGAVRHDVGLFLPLYALQSARSWGVGDLSDLERLLEWMPATGARVSSMLPILATDYGGDPCDPSPYLPVSRLFWNEIFIDPRRVPEFRTCEAARDLVASERFRRRIAALQAAPLIDYAGAAAAKREVLEILGRWLLRQPGRRAREFEDWVRRHPVAERYAVFRAARDAAGSDSTEGISPHHYHLYAQWVADQQVEQTAARARQVGDGLYLDFPLGVHPDGFDVSHKPALFASGISTGAPADELFPGGQNWGTPPPHPAANRRDGYRYLRASLARQMSVAGTLRIDHVMGVHRLFWIPRGATAADGLYVRYPADEVYALLCLESWRHRTRLVGENLGTVPVYVNHALARHGLRPLHVAQFNIDCQAGQPLAPAAPGAIASLNTHDTPTFAGFLGGADIDERLDRGTLDADDAARARSRRQHERAALERLPGVDPHAGSILQQMLHGCLTLLAQGRAALVLVNLEDLWLEPRAQNLPGTGPERRNWRRRMRHRLETVMQMPEVTETLRRLVAARPAPDLAPPGEDEAP